MIDTKLIFLKAGLEEVVHERRVLYKGQDEMFYDIKVTDKRVEIFRRQTPYEVPKKIIGVIRIYPDDDMVEIMSLCLKGIIDNTEAYMATYNDPENHVAFFRGTLGRNLGKRQIENLCLAYYETVRIGESTLEFTDIIKDVLKIHAMPITNGVLPEMHDLLLKVPDVCYDFLVEVERATERNEPLQRRCINYMKAHPKATCCDIVIYISILNANLKYEEPWMERVIDLVNSDSTFAIYDVNHGVNEIIRADNKHDWHIFDVFLGNRRSYTFRQIKSLVFADYRNICFCGAMVTKIGDDIAMLCDVCESENYEEGVGEGIIQYLEKIVVSAGFHNIVSFVKPVYISLYEELGYELCEDQIVDDPYEPGEERAFMWKKI